MICDTTIIFTDESFKTSTTKSQLFNVHRDKSKKEVSCLYRVIWYLHIKPCTVVPNNRVGVTGSSRDRVHNIEPVPFISLNTKITVYHKIPPPKVLPKLCIQIPFDAHLCKIESHESVIVL